MNAKRKAPPEVDSASSHLDNQVVPDRKRRIIGPTLPPDYGQKHNADQAESHAGSNEGSSDDAAGPAFPGTGSDGDDESSSSSDDDDIGPALPGVGATTVRPLLFS